MGDLSKNFSRHELACKCGCGQDTVDIKLVEFLQAIRDNFDAPISVHSGNRCSDYNARVGGAKHSQHMRSRAADITVRGHAPEEVADFAENLIGSGGGVGRYATFTHIDSRGYRARWTG